MVRIDEVEKKLELLKDFATRMIEPSDLKQVDNALKKEWRYLINLNFRRRKSLGLKTSGRLANAVIITIPEKNVIGFDTRLLYRNVADGEGGACFDYAQILRTGYAGGKPSMGKWMARSTSGRLIDAQLFDLEGNPIGNHGGMPPYLERVERLYEQTGGKILQDFIIKKFKRELRK